MPTAISPVQVTPEAVTEPVVTERSRESAAVSFIKIFPAVVFIFTAFRADAKKSILPVSKEISALSNAKSFGISALPPSA